MALDKTINFGKVEVSTGYDASATSIVLKTGDGAKLPVTGNFNMVWWNSTDYPDPIDDPNREIVRVTARSTDTLTVTRGQESTSAATHNTAGKTYKMILGITSKMITDIDAGLLPTSTGGQVLYGGAGGAWSALNIGTASQLLRVNSGATAPEWATISGGQTLYEAIVAPSGGDYTTLAAAITAGKTRIFVRNGTYSATANIVISSNDVHIIGESQRGVILSMTTYNLDITGLRCLVENLTIQSTTGVIYAQKDYTTIQNCYLYKTSGAGLFCDFRGTGSKYLGNTIQDTVNSKTSQVIIIDGRLQFANNIVLHQNTNSATVGIVYVTGAPIIANNIFRSGSGSATTLLLLESNNGEAIIANNEQQLTAGFGSGSYSIYCNGTSTANKVIIGNNLIAGIYLQGNQNNIIGNTFQAINATGHIVMNNAIRSQIVGNQFQRDSASPISIKANSATTNNNIKISGNTFYESSASSTASIDLANTTKVEVTNNYFAKSGAITNDTDPLTTVANNHQNTGVSDKTGCLMKNTSGGSLANGDVVVWKNVAAGDEITTTTTANDDKVFGVVAETIADTAYGYVQTKGQKSVVKVDGSGTNVAIGDYLTTSTTAKKAVKAASGETAFAIALAAASTDTTILCLLIEPRRIN